MIKWFNDLLDFIKQEQNINLLVVKTPRQAPWRIHTTWNMSKKSMRVSLFELENLFIENADIKYWYKSIEKCYKWFLAKTETDSIFFLEKDYIPNIESYINY